MTTFRIGDHVSWNSEAGRVNGTIIKVHTGDFDYKGHPRHASSTTRSTRSGATKPIISPLTRAAR
jgi:hypothetical protein